MKLDYMDILVFLLSFGIAPYMYSDSIQSSIDAVRFNSIWDSMQRGYGAISKELDCRGFRELEKTYYHPHWAKGKNSIKDLLHGQPNQNFLDLPAIGGSMVVVGWAGMQKYEIAFLKDYPSRRVANLIANYREPAIGPHERECSQINCSSNALHLLCYAAKILDLFESPEILVEFGSGYGCLAHIFKQLLPDCTLFLIDIPELLAIQYLYLQYALPQSTIIFHSEVTGDFQRGAIHLIPVHLLKDLHVRADVFVSTFALSESPTCVQRIVCDKKFFDAQVLYIAGQLYGWNHEFEDHLLIFSAARAQYSSLICMPFYYTLGMNIQSYELFAVNQPGIN